MQQSFRAINKRQLTREVEWFKTFEELKNHGSNETIQRVKVDLLQNCIEFKAGLIAKINITTKMRYKNLIWQNLLRYYLYMFIPNRFCFIISYWTQ